MAALVREVIVKVKFRGQPGPVALARARCRINRLLDFEPGNKSLEKVRDELRMLAEELQLTRERT